MTTTTGEKTFQTSDKSSNGRVQHVRMYGGYLRIASFSSRRLDGPDRYTRDFKYPHNRKSAGVKSMEALDNAEHLPFRYPSIYWALHFKKKKGPMINEPVKPHNAVTFGECNGFCVYSRGLEVASNATVMVVNVT
ncbi:hypothetical protein TNCV_3052361 [Trichonephila clavipes]|nr:hypothetical protein TNCV_3052361 [Trichonephila clavipes]